jgi:flagellar basal body-associated protein FliL
MKKKLMILVPVLLLGVGGAYKFALAKPEVLPPAKIEGEVYVLPKEFLVNLDGGKFAKLGVAMVFHHGFHSAPEGGGKHGAAPKPPDGFGVLPQEAVVRDIVTDEITGVQERDLTTVKGRKSLKKHILERLHKETDVEAEDILFTDIAVQ